MKIYKIAFISIFFFSGFFLGCSSDDSEIFEEDNTLETNETEIVEATQPKTDLEVENFIYRGMSDVYLYNENVEVLAENYFGSQEEKDVYLKPFSSPEDLFEDLMATQDRFSFLIEDFENFNKTSGSDATSGMSYSLVSYCNTCTDVFGFVRLVLPNTPAEEQGVERGMIFTKVDGVQLTTSNFSNLLAPANFNIGLASIEGNTITHLDSTITISQREYLKNPVVISKVLNVEDSKVGYIYYDSFTADFDEELNAAFGDLKAAGVTDLVLDLRYNSGGSVRTASDLAAMITGQFPGKLFMKEQWNEKYQTLYEQGNSQNLLNNFNTTLTTGTAINSLNLNRVFVLTTNSSASASELIINGLDPYIDVIHIGDITTGKFQASVALYDSPNFSEHHTALNASHTYALQPLVLKSLNANNVSDYVDGLTPDIMLIEDVRNLGVLGDPKEPLLKLALDVINNNKVSIPEVKKYDKVGESNMYDSAYQKMYIDEIPVIIEQE